MNTCMYPQRFVSFTGAFFYTFLSPPTTDKDEKAATAKALTNPVTATVVATDYYITS